MKCKAVCTGKKNSKITKNLHWSSAYRQNRSYVTYYQFKSILIFSNNSSLDPITPFKDPPRLQPFPSAAPHFETVASLNRVRGNNTLIPGCINIYHLLGLTELEGPSPHWKPQRRQNNFQNRHKF